MSILISAIMILTSLVSITASAEETVNIFETYTFEEFLALSEEEICAISEEIEQYYKTGQFTYTANKSLSNETVYQQPISVGITEAYANIILDANGSYTATSEQLFNTLMLPETIDSSGYKNYHFEPEYRVGANMIINPSVYGDLNSTHVFACVYTWMRSNSNVEFVTPAMLGASAPTQPATGDVDENDTIDIADAAEVLAIYANTAADLSAAEYTATQLTAADADANGTVDINDATAILTYYAQKAAGLEPTWEDILAS
jgi:hypothetical protein